LGRKDRGTKKSTSPAYVEIEAKKKGPSPKNKGEKERERDSSSLGGVDILEKSMLWSHRGGGLGRGRGVFVFADAVFGENKLPDCYPREETGRTEIYRSREKKRILFREGE